MMPFALPSSAVVPSTPSLQFFKPLRCAATSIINWTSLLQSRLNRLEPSVHLVFVLLPGTSSAFCQSFCFSRILSTARTSSRVACSLLPRGSLLIGGQAAPSEASRAAGLPHDECDKSAREQHCGDARAPRAGGELSDAVRADPARPLLRAAAPCPFITGDTMGSASAPASAVLRDGTLRTGAVSC